MTDSSLDVTGTDETQVCLSGAEWLFADDALF